MYEGTAQEYAKMQADKMAYAQTQARNNGDGCSNGSMREQAEHNVRYHRIQADKYDRAAAFFRENPAFDEFIQLVRSGAIQF